MKLIKSVEVIKLSKAFGKRVLFSDFSYRFIPGKLYVLEGPSGCGKTTLLQIVSGEQKKTNGLVLYNGEKKRDKQRISYLPSESQIFMELSVVDNLRIVCPDKEKIAAVLAGVGLKGKEEEKGALLSKGESTRLAIARIILMDKDVILLDEPTGNLDHENASQIFSLIKSLSRNRIVIVSSHDRFLSDEQADTVFSYQNKTIEIEERTETILKKGEQKSFNTEKGIERKADLKGKLLCSLRKKNRKQTILFTPILLVLNLLFLFCLSFISTNGGDYLEKAREECNITGRISQKYKEAGNKTAERTRITFSDAAEYYPAMYNSVDEFKTMSTERKINSGSGIVIPSDLAEKYSLKVGDNVTVGISRYSYVGTVEQIYSSQAVNREKVKHTPLFQSRKEEQISSIERANNPILVSYQNIQKQKKTTLLGGYCSSLYFKQRYSLALEPVFMESFDTSTRNFWLKKSEYDYTVFILASCTFGIELLSSFIYLIGLGISFKQENVVLYSIYGNKKISFLLFCLFSFALLGSIILLSLIIGLASVPAINGLMTTFYGVNSFLPLRSYSLPLFVGLLISYILLFVLSLCLELKNSKQQ